MDKNILVAIAEAKADIKSAWDAYNAKETPLTEPMSVDAMMAQSKAENGFAPDKGRITVHGIVSVELSEVISADIESFLDLISERLCGSILLMDINYTVVGVENGVLSIRVTGNAFDITPGDIIWGNSQDATEESTTDDHDMRCHPCHPTQPECGNCEYVP